MAGTSKGFDTTKVQQGPGDIWQIITGTPVDATPRLTLFTDGTPDASIYTDAVHLGLCAGATTTLLKPTLEHILADQADAPVDSYVTKDDMTIEAELEQLAEAKLARILSVGVASTGSGYKQITFGGLMTVPKICLAVISPRRDSPTKFIQSIMFNAASTGPLSFPLGRAKPSTYKAKFHGAADLTRTVGQQIGVLVRGLVAPTGTTATARDFTVSEIQQGPANLWIIGTPPDDTAKRLTLAADLTPDATAHPNSLGLGLIEGAATLTLTPKIEEIRADQSPAPVDFTCTGLDAKIEATILQSDWPLLAKALGVTGAYSIDAGGTPAWEQVVFGGGTIVTQAAVAVIAPKRSDPTKFWVALLYKALSGDGVGLLISRTKMNTVKLVFTGVADLARTAGRQTGILYETV